MVIANILFRCHFKPQCGSPLCVSRMPTLRFHFGSQESLGSWVSCSFSAVLPCVVGVHVLLHELTAQNPRCCSSPRLFSQSSSLALAVRLFLET